MVQYLVDEVQRCQLLKITGQRKYLPTKYNINASKLQEVNHHPCLGVELSLDLTWKKPQYTSKAHRILCLRRRHLYGCNHDVKDRAFISLVQPHLEYSSSVWDPYFKQDILAIEKVQRKGARFVTGIYSYRESVTSMLDDLHWPPLQHRRKIKRLTAIFKATNNLSPVTSYHSQYVTTSSNRTRPHELAYIQLHANYEQYKNSFLLRTIRDGNALPPDLVHAASVDEFTARLQTHTF